MLAADRTRLIIWCTRIYLSNYPPPYLHSAEPPFVSSFFLTRKPNRERLVFPPDRLQTGKCEKT